MRDDTLLFYNNINAHIPFMPDIVSISVCFFCVWVTILGIKIILPFFGRTEKKINKNKKFPGLKISIHVSSLGSHNLEVWNYIIFWCNISILVFDVNFLIG